MPKINNLENNVVFELELLNNRYLDIKKERTKYENWIPFKLKLTINDRDYIYSDENGATFTHFEIENFILNLDNIIELKKKNLKSNRFEFSSSETYFDFVIYDPQEENELYIEIWINIGSYSKGSIFGYDEGVRFVANTENVNSFKEDLKKQLNKLLNKDFEI